MRALFRQTNIDQLIMQILAPKSTRLHCNAREFHTVCLARWRNDATDVTTWETSTTLEPPTMLKIIVPPWIAIAARGILLGGFYEHRGS